MGELATQWNQGRAIKIPAAETNLRGWDSALVPFRDPGDSNMQSRLRTLSALRYFTLYDYFEVFFLKYCDLTRFKQYSYKDMCKIFSNFPFMAQLPLTMWFSASEWQSSLLDSPTSTPSLVLGMICGKIPST